MTTLERRLREVAEARDSFHSRRTDGIAGLLEEAADEICRLHEAISAHTAWCEDADELRNAAERQP